MPVVPQRGGGKQRAFETVGGFASERRTRGAHGVAVFFKIKRKGVEEILNFLRRSEPFEDGEFGGGVTREWSHMPKCTTAGKIVSVHSVFRAGEKRAVQ
jgi:hypothetical protein